MRNYKGILSVFLFFVLCGFGGQAHALTLPLGSTSAFLYGDFYSYSLPILAYQYDLENGGGTGPGNPFYVNSTPGVIKNDIVIATGASGKPVNTNFTGMDDAYPTPNSTGTPTFETGTTADPTPGPTPGFVGDQESTWDTQLSALTNYLAGEDLAFFFNNNQTNSGDAADQNLFAWAQASLRDSDTGAAPIYFDFTNTPPGGEPGGNPADYNSPGVWMPGPTPTDYVLSGGQLCLDGAGSLVDCGDVAAVETINHNLGANQAVYALVSPELNDFIRSWDNSSAYDTLSLDIRLRDLNDGYEQIFIQTVTVIPEPSTLLLLGGGLVGLGFWSRRKDRK